MYIGTPTSAASFVHQAYCVSEWNHAETILTHQFPDAYDEVLRVLAQFRLHAEDIVAEGGSKSPMSKGIETPLNYLGWKKKEFDIQVQVNEVPHFSHLRRIDHFKDRIALEIEWSNKDPFFDRDLENFRFLYHLNLISAGIIITRSESLEILFKELKKAKVLKSTKYGPATTRMDKLLWRIQSGGGGGCPIMVFGITRDVYVDEQKEQV